MMNNRFQRLLRLARVACLISPSSNHNGWSRVAEVCCGPAGNYTANSRFPGLRRLCFFFSARLCKRSIQRRLLANCAIDVAGDYARSVVDNEARHLHVARGTVLPCRALALNASLPLSPLKLPLCCLGSSTFDEVPNRGFFFYVYT